MHDYTDKEGILISVADSGLLYSDKIFKGCKKFPVYYRMLNLNDCTVENCFLYYKGSLSEMWQLFEEWNDYGGVVYAPLKRKTAQKEETDKLSEIFDKSVGRI